MLTYHSVKASPEQHAMLKRLRQVCSTFAMGYSCKPSLQCHAAKTSMLYSIANWQA